MRRTRIVIAITVAVALLLVFAAGSFRRYPVQSSSNSPTYLLGDRLLVNLMAYDLKIPFTNLKIVSWANPKRGDMVLMRVPKSPYESLVAKRVAAVPGDNFELRDCILFINGKQAAYTYLDSTAVKGIPPENEIGSVSAIERMDGTEHLITFSPDMRSRFGCLGPLYVGPRYYCMLNDNRNNTNDSRRWGLLNRRQIVGKVIGRVGGTKR